jgi:hypothetical protein
MPISSLPTRAAKWLTAFAFAGFATMAMAQAEPTLNEVYAQAQSGQVDKAQVMMQQVLVAHPNSAKAHFVQAELFARQGQLGRARESLATAEKLAPGLVFAKPDAVQALRTQLAGSNTAAPVARAATQPASSPFPWGMALLVGGGVLAFGIYMFGKSRKPASTYTQQEPQGGLSGPQSFGNPQAGYGMAPSYGQAGYGQNPYGQAPSSGLGGKVMGGLATGLAVGAGVMAAQAIGSHLMGSKEPHASDNGFANNDFAAPNTNADMGGQDFGMNDTSSWDDGGALASNDGGGSDWDT